jgi:cytochrome c553
VKDLAMKRRDLAGLLVMGAIVFLGSGGAKAEADPIAGKEKTRICAGCHGIDDYRTAFPEVYSVPRLGGQVAGYLEKSLKDYGSGARKHISMQGMAAALSEQDIADIAAYYASGPLAASNGAAHAGGSDAIRKKAGETCAACHGKPGDKPTLPGAPSLAGQQYEYLVHALNAFRSGTRENAMMGPLAKSLSDADIRGLSEYYSALPGLSTKY